MNIKEWAKRRMSEMISERAAPFYTGSSKWRKNGKFDANEIKKGRKKRTRKKK